MKIVPNRFTDIYDRYGLDETVVNSTCIYDNCLFIGTKSSGLTIIGSTGMESSIFGTRAMSMAKGVKSAMQRSPVSNRVMKRSRTKPANGSRER